MGRNGSGSIMRRIKIKKSWKEQIFFFRTFSPRNVSSYQGERMHSKRTCKKVRIIYFWAFFWQGAPPRVDTYGCKGGRRSSMRLEALCAPWSQLDPFRDLFAILLGIDSNAHSDIGDIAIIREAII